MALVLGINVLVPRENRRWAADGQRVLMRLEGIAWGAPGNPPFDITIHCGPKHGLPGPALVALRPG